MPLLNAQNSSSSIQHEGALPNFCDARVLLLLMLVAEGLAIILVMGQSKHIDGVWAHLGNYSLFIQSVALIDAGILCWSKRKLQHLPNVSFYIWLYVLLQLVTILLTLVAYQLLVYISINPGSSLTSQLVHNLCVSAIISGAMLRYFYVRHQNLLQQHSESEARIQALQARIRPHFLFNSLNTIANLIHGHPDTAEEALLDLAELFRSTMGKQSYISLEDELEIVRRYLRIEKLRLGDRLTVDWDIPAELNNISIPALILQPLIENAIYHGIEPLPGGGHVRINARQESERVRIDINNPLAPNFVPQRTRGNQVAVENIRQRLALAYGTQASLEQIQNDVQYTVALSFPIHGDANFNS